MKRIEVETLSAATHDDYGLVELPADATDKYIAYRMRILAGKLSRKMARPNWWYKDEYATEGDIIVADGIYPIYGIYLREAGL